MRKYIRNLFRAEGKRRKATVSKWVRAAWDKYQCDKVGAERRKVNKAKGTHTKDLWSSRILLAQSK